VSTLYLSPLHALHAGDEAVFVFFILSGLVLGLPLASGRAISWLAYYPKRIVRLYVPVIAATALALAAMTIVPRFADESFSFWINRHAVEASPIRVLKEVFLLFGTGAFNSVLWSLRWEVLFSLLLPLYVLAARRVRRAWILGIAVMLGLSCLGQVISEDHLIYLPLFGLGVILAFALPDLRRAYETWLPLGPVTFFAAALGLSAAWGFPDFIGRHALSVAGCCLIVLAFVFWKPAVRFASGTTIQWLGSRSFSLYLVHEPIVVSAALLFRGSPWWAGSAVAILAALILTEFFFRLVEKPSIRLAGNAGRGASRLAPKHSRATLDPTAGR
jgi:peptidoglycan/LPS O-acetylase OafA/YrhL